MVDVRPPEGEEPQARKRLADVMLFLEEVASEIVDKYREVISGDAPRPKEAQDLANELRKWASLAFEEQAKIDKFIKDRSPGTADGVIDFGAVRAQIGGRLAQLRAAGNSGDVPEGSDGT